MVLNKKIKLTISSGLTLALRNVKLQMREHLLGYAWVLIIPMLYAVCYIFIKKELTGGADLADGNVNWDALRAFSGITLFQFWIQLIQSMSDLVRKQKGMLRGLNISATPFALGVMFEGALALFIRALLIIAAVPLLGLEFPQGITPWLLFFSCLLALLLTATAIGLFLLPWAALYADVRKALSSVTLPMLLISPVFYPAVKDSDSWLYLANSINPVASPLAVLADTFQGSSDLMYVLPMMIWAGLALIIIVRSLRRLKRQVPILLERIGN